MEVIGFMRPRGRTAGRLPERSDERPFESALDAPTTAVRGPRYRHLTTSIIIGFWVVQYAVMSALFALMNPSVQLSLYLPRAIVSGAGLLISFGMVAVQRRLRGSRLATRAAVAGAMAVVAAAIHGMINMIVFYAMVGVVAERFEPTFSAYIQDYIYRFAFFIAVSIIILALSDADDPDQHDSRVVELVPSPELLDSEPQTERTWWRVTLAVVVAFWMLWYVAYTSYSLMNHATNSVLLPRFLIAASGVAVSLAIAAVFNALRSFQLSMRALAAIPLSLAGTAIHSVITVHIWAWVMPDDKPTSPLWVVYATDFIIRFWFFAAQSAIILALSYAADVREREERIRALQALAHSAQLRALRNQLNPHFLFNALNSIMGLMSARRIDEAEMMTANLSDFLRTTLALDPQRLITLDEELELQTLYLDVQKLRFPDRLRVEIDIPSDLRSACVPSLITQPLVENSVKYAVARSTEPVQLRIWARQRQDRLELGVEDSGGNAETALVQGARLGLANVADRLRTHYAGDARFEAAVRPEGGFRNLMTIPLRTT